MSIIPIAPTPKKTHAGNPNRPASIAAPLRLARPAISAAIMITKPIGIAMRICTNIGQIFFRETAAISFHRTLTTPETRHIIAPAMNSAL